MKVEYSCNRVHIVIDFEGYVGDQVIIDLERAIENVLDSYHLTYKLSTDFQAETGKKQSPTASEAKS